MATKRNNPRSGFATVKVQNIRPFDVVVDKHGEHVVEAIVNTQYGYYLRYELGDVFNMQPDKKLNSDNMYKGTDLLVKHPRPQ